jgi:hypothetical protein
MSFPVSCFGYLANALLWGYCEALRYVRLFAVRALSHRLQKRSARLLLKNGGAIHDFVKTATFGHLKNLFIS